VGCGRSPAPPTQSGLPQSQTTGQRRWPVVWTKGYEQSGLSTVDNGKDAGSILVRILRFTATIRGFRHRRVTLVTTLLDPQLYPAGQIIALYGRRWSVELCFRDLKTTMGMEALRCQSPEMAEKELLAYLIAHNLVRCVMAEAVARYQGAIRADQFQGSLDALRQYSTAMAQAPNRKLRRALWDDLLLNLARDLVPLRPNRREPRAVKRRPKAYPLLNNRAIASSKSPTAAATGKADPRNYHDLN